MKHTKAMTYRPKLDPVFDGRCHQTIRMGNSVKEGDIIEFHTWAGIPCRSKWGRRITVEVKEAVPINVYEDIISSAYRFWEENSRNQHGFWYFPWDSREIDNLARLDFIDPPKGTELKAVLSGQSPNSVKHDGDWIGEYQIIRW